MSATAACILQLGLYAPHKNDVLFSFLPLAHTMERCCELAVYMAGGAVGFYSGKIDIALRILIYKAACMCVCDMCPQFVTNC